MFTDTVLTLPTECINEEERGLGVHLGWFSPSKKRSSHRDTDVLLAFRQVLTQKAKSKASTSAQGSGRGRRCLPARTGLSWCFRNTIVEGVLLYTPQGQHIHSFISGALGLWTLFPLWTQQPSINMWSTWSLTGACWAPLLDFCLGPCREAPGTCAVAISLAWSIALDANISLRNKGWRLTCRQSMTPGKCHFPATCTSWFLLSSNSQEAGHVFLKDVHFRKCSPQHNLQHLWYIQDLIMVAYHPLHTCKSGELHFCLRP